MATLTRYDITDLNNGAIAEHPVADPPGWDEISLYYAKALQKMGWNESGRGDAPDAPPNPKGDRRKPPTATPNPANTWTYGETPDDYYFWGAMHWWPGKKWELWGAGAPAPQNAYWSHCTHGPAQVEQYFLPWHRAYIYFFEVAIQRAIAALEDDEAPDDWALPYWNYSFFDDSDPSQPWPRACLPWCFCQPKLPDGSGNPLFLDVTRRGLQPLWPEGDPMFLGELTPYYDGAYGQASWLPARQLDGFNATLDFVGPHGPVHVDVGTGDGVRSGTGWMQNTQTAGFDPIFWLHHSEVDRFWVGWNEAGGADPDSHTAPAWADASDDSVAGRWNFWKDGNIDNAIVIHPGDMIDPANLDPAKFPYSYEYQDLPTVPAPRQGGREAVAAEVPTLARPASPTPPAPAIANRELGTNPPEPVVVGHDPVTTTVQLQPEARSLLRTLDADNDDEPKRVILRLEGIVTKPPAGNYAVYLNRSGADHDTPADAPHLVGMFTAFGSDHDHGDDHEHHGMNASYDITDLVGYLRGRGEWEESAAQVTFVLATPRGRKVNPVAGPVTVGNVRIVSE